MILEIGKAYPTVQEVRNMIQIIRLKISLQKNKMSQSQVLIIIEGELKERFTPQEFPSINVEKPVVDDFSCKVFPRESHLIVCGEALSTIHEFQG